MTQKSIRIDALRGAAILAVLQFHYGYGFRFYEWIGVPTALETILAYGWAGVDLFFVLSAYLLTRNLLSSRGETNVVGSFYRRRILRILPLYVLLLALAAILAPALGTRQGDAGGWLFGGLAPFWTYGLFLQNFWSGLQGVWGGHFLAPTWSLAVEEHFYLILPFLVLGGGAWRIAVLSCAFIVLGPLFRALIADAIGPMAAQTWSFARIDCFGWGMLVALALSLGEPGRAQFKLLWQAAAGLFVAAFGCLALIRGADGYNPLPWSINAMVAARFVIETARPPAVSTIASPQSEGVLVKAAAWMGARCYSLYLLHMPIAGLAAAAIGRANPAVTDAASALALGAAALATLVLSDLSYRFVECPFVAYGARRMRDARAACQASA